MNSSPWRLEEVDGGDEQYPEDPHFERSTPTKVRFLRFAVCHTPPDQKDPVSTIEGPREVRFLPFAVRQTPPGAQDPISTVVG